MLKFLKILCAVFVAAFLFVVIFPLVHPIEKMNGQMAARGGEGKFVRLGKDLDIHYIEQGNATQTLILIHGFSSSVFTWKDNIPALAKHARVYALDMMGFGFSSKPLKARYGYGEFAEVLYRFMKEKGIKSAVLCGNSMGGGISVKFTAQHPDMVDSLILVDSAGYGGHKGFNPLVLLGKPIIGPFFMSLNSPKVLDVILKKMMFYDGNRVTAERDAAYFKTFQVHGSARAAIKTIRAIADTKLSDDIAKIHKPTLILWGENDNLIVLETGKKFHADIKGSRLAVIPKCGHLPQEELPGEFNKIVLEFLSGSKKTD